jgi:protocatechuate 3,4-dioxygenase beta subunit
MADSVQEPQTDDHGTTITRRQAVGTGMVASAGLLLAVGTGGLLGSSPADAASACATLTPEKTIGPFFVEEKLNRSDITTDPDTGKKAAGIPLTLSWTLLNEDASCAPLAGAQVDVWHADSGGTYSDEAQEGTTGNKVLRGYQVSDAKGKVTFKTIYPGWYSGRTVHIHMRIRLFDSSGKATYDFTSQVFFDDALTDKVYAASPYSARGTRDTRNAADSIYGSDGGTCQLAMSGSNAAGYVGAFTFGLTGTGVSGGTKTPSDTKVSGKLASAKFMRTNGGSRVLVVKLTTKETTAVTLRLLRGSKVIKRRTIKTVRSGTHTLSLPIAHKVSAGRITLSLTLTDRASNRKTLTKILHLRSAR